MLLETQCLKDPKKSTVNVKVLSVVPENINMLEKIKVWFTQVVECLPSKYETLSSPSSMTKRNNSK
jgi:hypothetical protein